MPKEQLKGLIADVDRLLAAGAPTALGHEGLRRRAKTLTELSQKVPALKPAADTVTRVVDSNPKQVGPAFLDMLLLTRQLRSSLTEIGLEGKLEPLPKSGPWQAPLSVRDLKPVAEALTSSSGSNREETLKEAIKEKRVNDLRLLSPLLDSLGGYATMADMIAEKGLAQIGAPVLPELLAKLSVPEGKAPDTRRLIAVCKIDAGQGADLCRRSLKEGSPQMRIKALELLPDVGKKGEAEKAGLELVRDKTKDVRMAALTALRLGVSDEALDVLVEAVTGNEDDAAYRAVESLRELPHPHTTARLMAVLQERVAALPAKAPKAPKGAKPNSKEMKAFEKESRAYDQQVSVIRRLLDLLAGRPDRRRADLAEAVLALADHKVTDIAQEALEALGGIGPATDQVLPRLTQALGEKSSSLVQTALQALGEMKPEDRAPVIPTILKMFANAKTSREFRGQALPLVAPHFAQHGAAILKVIKEHLEHKDHWVATSAVSAAGELGPAAMPLVPTLMKRIKSHGYGYYNNNLLTQIDPEGTTLIPQILPWLDEKKSEIRARALQFLEPYAKKAEAALPRVIELEDDKDYYVKYMAERTRNAIERGVVELDEDEDDE